jgi:hypothetical protein
MTLQAYIKKLSKIAEKHPKAQIIFTNGEGFDYINYTDYVLNPKLGYFDGEDFAFEGDGRINAVLLS